MTATRRPAANSSLARRVAAGVAAVVVVTGVVQLVLGARYVGLSVDEPSKVSSFETWLDTGWYMSPGKIGPSGKPDSDAVAPYVYGVSYSLLSHVPNVLAGNEAPGTISQSSTAYAVRHGFSALLGLVTVAAVGAMVWITTSSRLAGLWTSAALFAIPVWTGFSFVHPKDIPVATGYTLITLGMVAAYAFVDRSRSRTMTALVAATVAGGVIIGIGTRFAIWLPVALSVSAFLLLVVIRVGLSQPRRVLSVVYPMAVGLVVGGMALAAMHPGLARQPLRWLVRSVRSSSEFPAESVTLTAGHELGPHPPWWYLPTWIGGSLPLLLLGLALLGGVVLTWGLVHTARRRGVRDALERRDAGLVLVVLQLLVLPIATIAGRTTMYGGVAKVLFVFPAVAVLAGYGVQRMWERLAAKPRGRYPQWILATVASLALLVPTFVQLQLFPFNAAYKNPVAALGGVDGRWEVPSVIAAREGIQQVPRDGRLVNKLPASLQVYQDERGVEADPDLTLGPGEYWYLDRVRAGRPLPARCTSVDDVTRRMGWQHVTMFFVARCHE